MADVTGISEVAVFVFTIDGKPYELDIAEFNGEETGILKRMGGLRGAMDIPDAIRVVDLEAIAACAFIAMRRSGGNPDGQALMQAKIGRIVVSLKEDDTAPPIEPAPEKAADEVAGDHAPTTP